MMSTGDKVWYRAHLAATIVIAAIVVTAFVLLGMNSNLLIGTIHAPIILLFVMPGALLVFGINQLILWRRKPRVIRASDRVVIVIVAALTLITFLTTFSEDIGIWVGFASVPLLIVAGIVSTIVIAVGNSRANEPPLQVAPVEPGTAPVGATLDQLFPESAVPAAEPAAPSGAEPAADESPYGPKP